MKIKVEVAVMFANVWKSDSSVCRVHICVCLQYVMQAQARLCAGTEL